jgi:hypothetical protein
MPVMPEEQMPASWHVARIANACNQLHLLFTIQLIGPADPDVDLEADLEVRKQLAVIDKYLNLAKTQIQQGNV